MMGEKTGISWCDHTRSTVWGCTKVSEGCRRCYAEVFAKRLGLDLWGPDAERRPFGDAYWREPLRWNQRAQKEGVRRRVFCSSMGDVFEDHPTTRSQLPRLWETIRQTPWLDWMLLTKRPENILECLPSDWRHGYPNVWLGTSTETQADADRRVPEVVVVPAVVRFLSAEPLLGPIDYSGEWSDNEDMAFAVSDYIHLVIVGGETGHGFRAMEPAWARMVRDWCASTGTAFFYKQDSGLRPGKNALLDGVAYQELPKRRVAA